MELWTKVKENTVSLFLDEYRGDLRQAYNDVIEYQSQLEKTGDSTDSDVSNNNNSNNSNDPEQMAYFLQSKTAVYMLMGRFQDAHAALDEYGTLVDNSVSAGKLDTSWGLRHAAFEALVGYYRRFPPCIRYQHESQAPPNMSLIGDIKGPIDIRNGITKAVQKYCSMPTENLASLQAEFQICLAFQMLVSFPEQLRRLTIRHPLYPEGNWKEKTRDGKNPEEAIAEMAPHLQKLVQKVPIEEETNANSLYFQRIYAEFYYAIDLSSPLQTTLQKLSDAYERIADKAGMANCKLIEGDSLLSPVFTSPIIQNLIPIPTNNACGENALWELIEPKIYLESSSSSDSDQANQCYEQALQLFQESNSPRGRATVLLRQGGILHDQACALDLTNTERKSLLDTATAKYNESLALFDLDEANVQLVKANQILLEISKGQSNIADLKKSAADIGKWGRECQNELIPHHIGMLMLRFARREWGKYSRFDTAYTCYECAFECHNALKAVMPAFIAKFGRVRMQHEMSNSEGKTVLVNECITTIDDVMESLRQQIDAINPDTPIGKLERQHLLIRKHDFIQTFNTEVMRILASQKDTIDALESFRKWDEKFLWYAENDECFDYFDRKKNKQLEGIDVSQLFFGKSLYDTVDGGAVDQAISNDYWKVQIEFNRCIDNGNLEQAEAAMRGFVKDSSQKYKRIYTQYMFQMLAYNKIGDTSAIREILDSLTDSELFGDRLDEFLQGKNVEIFFSSLAQNAMYMCMIAQDWERGLRVLELVLKISPFFIEQSSSTDSPIDRAVTQVTAAAICQNNNQPELAFRILLKARHLTELRRSHADDVDVKVGALSKEMVIYNFSLLAEICLQCAELNLPTSILDAYDHGNPEEVTWEEHALLFIEESRARSLIDSLLSSTENNSMDSEEQKNMSESIYKRRALIHLQSISKRTPRQNKELEELVQEVGRLDVGTWSSSASDLMDTTMNSKLLPHQLFDHLHDDVVVIEASFFRSGCILMAVTNKGIQAYERKPVPDVDIRKYAMEMMQIMGEMEGYLTNPDEADLKAKVENLSTQISDILLTPFVDIIRDKRHVIFSSSQPLTAFPFSALLFDGKPLFLHAAVSQVPSLTVLYHLSKRQAASSEPTVSVFTKAFSHHHNQEGASANDRSTDEEYLPMAGIEAIRISNMFTTWPIEASTLTRAQFRDYLQGQTSILHIGTHGNLNVGRPLLSSISIGEDFRVIDMSPIQSHANLIVFAACLSGLGRATSGNDVLGFTHVVLGTGCQAYLGALFEVNDFTSMVLMALFYRNIKNEPNLPIAEALRRAQTEFWHFDNDKASAFIDEILGDWETTTTSSSINSPEGNNNNNNNNNNNKNPDDIVPNGKFLLMVQKRIVSQIDWTSPIFWAPFSLMGYGDFSFSHSHS